MASLRKRPGRAYWYLDWHEHPGASGRRLISTGIRHNNAKQPPRQGAAWDILMAKEAELSRRKFGLAQAIHDTETAPFLNKHLQWIKTTSGDISEGTLIRYQSVISIFTRWALAEGLTSFSQFTYEVVSRFVLHRAADKSSKTVAMDCDFLAQVWDEAKSHSHVLFEDNPWRKLRPASVKMKSRRAFTIEEISYVLQHLGDLKPWEQFVFVMALYTGARLTSVVLLPRNQVHRDVNVISFPDEIVKKKPYTVPIHPLVLQFLDSYEGGDKTHFVPADVRERHKRYAFAQKMVQENIASWRELTTKQEPPGLFHGVSFHCLRHTFVTHLRQSGASKSEAQLLAGHASASINEVYTHVEAQVLAPVIERLDYVV